MNSDKKLDLAWDISLILCGVLSIISGVCGITGAVLPRVFYIAYAVIAAAALIVLVYYTFKKLKAWRERKK